MTDQELLRAFESCTLPFAEWNHRAHVRVAYLYLRAHDLDEATRRMRAGILRFNAANHVPESPDRGYHETVTRAWLHLVWLTLSERGPEETSEQFLDRESQLCARRALLFFYSRDRIMSPEARAGFVEPDLSPLPQPQAPR
ncbi:MAG: hypothetical protein ACO1SX_05700 [Actinomycetota bacterium]